MKMFKNLIFVVLFFFDITSQQNQNLQISFDKLFPQTQIQKIFDISITILKLVNKIYLSKENDHFLIENFFKNIFNLLIKLNYEIVILNKFINKKYILSEDIKYLNKLIKLIHYKFNQSIKILDKRVL